MFRVFRLIGVITICAALLAAPGAIGMAAPAHSITAIDTTLAGRFERAEKIFNTLAAEAGNLRDDFGAIAAMLYDEAWRQSLALEGVHSLAARLDASAGASGAPGIRANVASLVRDVRQLIAAHLIFKALAEQETDVRRLFDLAPAAAPLAHTTPIEAQALLDRAVAPKGAA